MCLSGDYEGGLVKSGFSIVDLKCFLSSRTLQCTVFCCCLDWVIKVCIQFSGGFCGCTSGMFNKYPVGELSFAGPL